MKKYLLVMIVLAFGSMMCLPAGSLLAQEEEETKYSWGHSKQCIR